MQHPDREDELNRHRSLRRFLRRALVRFEVAQILRFGRSLLSLVFRTPVLVLETTGRRSGKRRRTPLARHRRGDDLLIVAGAAGSRRTPDWVLNLRTDERAVVTLDRRTIEVGARELRGAERREAWRELVEVWPRIERYERRSGRVVPVFRLREASARPQP